MSRLVTLISFILLTGWAHAQTQPKNAVKSKPEFIANEDILEQPVSPLSAETTKSKSTTISSAARKSSLQIHSAEKGPAISPNVKKHSSNLKSITQARRSSTIRRPVHINIPVVPAPSIIKPNRLTVPNRRFSLPVGKS